MYIIRLTLMQEAEMYVLMEELARERQRSLLAEADAERAARALRAGRQPRGVRRAAGRFLIEVGARLAGAAAAYPVAGRSRSVG